MECAGRIIFEGVEERLVDLHTRIHTGGYRDQPARRTTIPKADGSSRSLSIWCLEDKIVQQSVTTVLSAVYEEDFLGFSYGSRQGRGQHDALDALFVGICRRKVNWILDADIQSFFDRIDHDWMMRFMEHRIGDKRLLRLVRKWLKVGVLDEEGNRVPSSCGAAQGAMISPLLANIYLHYVLDLWSHSRRSQRHRMTVARFHRIMARYFPAVRVIHPYPAVRFDANTQGRSPVR